MNTRHGIAFLALGTLGSLAACEKENHSTPLSSSTAPVNNRVDANGRDDAYSTPAPDNTAWNKVDRTGDTKTPMDQSQSRTDINISADIRNAIMDDKSMSINAQNCKIITENSGLVTLRGVVSSQGEKDSIDAKARAVAGVAQVDNQLEVTTN